MNVSKTRITIRKATKLDIPSISKVMNLAINELQTAYLSPSQITASMRSMGLDTQLIEDGTYYCAWVKGEIVGCGGWSYRATLYGGNHSEGRDSRIVDPTLEPGKIRAMYTHPEYIRRGVGRRILRESERAARLAGFQSMEMAATLAGEDFYKRCGYQVKSRWFDKNGSVDIPLITMTKPL